MVVNVGVVRHFTAFQDSDALVVVDTDDDNLKKILNGKRLEIVSVHQDTADVNGKSVPVCKVKIVIAEPQIS